MARFLFGQLSKDAVRKIHLVIEKDEENSDTYLVRIPYKPNADVNGFIYLPVECLVTKDGVGWDSTNMMVPHTCTEESHTPHGFEECPVIDLTWTDLSEILRKEILRNGGLL